MLITFTSDAHENITMFGSVAIQLIKMMGHGGTVPGAIVAKDIPAALNQLKEAIDQEKQKPAPEKKNEDEEPPISLAHRAVPLISLLQHAAEKNCDVLWS